MANRGVRTSVILTPGTTDAVTSDVFSVGQSDHAVVILYPQATLGADTALLQIQDPAGTWVTMTQNIAGADENVSLSATHTTYKIPHAGVYRISVTTRTGSWGIGLIR